MKQDSESPPSLSASVSGLCRLKEAPSITVVRAGALGDTILTLPVLFLLKAHFPYAEITFCGSHWAGKLAALSKTPYHFFPFDSSVITPLFAESPQKPDAPVFDDADVIILYTTDLHGTIARNLRRFYSSSLITIDITPAQIHIALQMTAPLVSGWVDLLNPIFRSPSLETPEPVSKLIGKLYNCPGDKPFCIIHPGSGSPGKIVHPDFFIQIAKEAREKGIRPVILEGPADAESSRRVLSGFGSQNKPEKITGIPLPHTAALLKECRFFSGNDSGVSHLAAAMGARTTVMFKNTDPEVWKPVGRYVKTVLTASGCRLS